MRTKLDIEVSIADLKLKLKELEKELATYNQPEEENLLKQQLTEFNNQITTFK